MAIEEDPKKVQALINGALDIIGHEQVYLLSLKEIDLEALKNANPPLTREELVRNFSFAGFVAGIRFTLLNLDVQDE